MRNFRLVVASALVLAVAGSDERADAATITVSYEHGYRDAHINDYGTRGMGTFRLVDGNTHRIALCIEAADSHSTERDAYAPVANRLTSPELDVLVWLVSRMDDIDDDTAIAAASLAWYYADATRSIGVPVWSNGARGFTRIGPLEPEPWDALGEFTRSHPVGLRSGTHDLDSAERRVAELHRRVRALRGPWAMRADAGGRTVRLSGPGGPIAGMPVRFVIEPADGAPRNASATTDRDGVAAVELPLLPDGGRITASVDGPGIHREWDGERSIQRMVTAESVSVTARFDVPQMPRHLVIVKRSTDPTIGVAGGEFVLFDGAGGEAGRAVSDASGRAVFEPVDPAQHPAPYSLRETVPPPGLVAVADDIPIAGLSHDRSDPTVVEIDDAPATVEVRVRKHLSVPGVGPADRSGFVFEFVRREDDEFAEATTGIDGATTTVDLALGTYDVCERASPDWATTLVDGGCQSLEVTLDLLSMSEPIDVPYLNIVPTPTIDTRAEDAGDGDRTLPAEGGVVIDQVRLERLVPGTTYKVSGEILDDEGEAIDVVASTTFEAVESVAAVQVQFDVPPRAPGSIVIVERLTVGDMVVAEHVDPTDPDQTLVVASPAATTPTTISPTTTTTTSTTTTIATNPSTSVASMTSTPIATPPTLPATGGDAAASLLRIGDITLAAGVGLIALAGLLPRRRTM